MNDNIALHILNQYFGELVSRKKKFVFIIIKSKKEVFIANCNNKNPLNGFFEKVILEFCKT